MIGYWIFLVVIVFFLVVLFIDAFNQMVVVNTYRVKLREIAKLLIDEGVINIDDKVNQPIFTDDWIQVLDEYVEKKKEEERLKDLARQVRRGNKLLRNKIKEI